MSAKRPIYLGVNIDHVATVRQARKISYPEPVHAALVAEQAGANSITMHLREDRRHIQDRDLFLVKELIHIPLNFEMAVTDEMLKIAERLKPAYCCLVPEKRQEVTTEGGLDVEGNLEKVKAATAFLKSKGIKVSLFIDPEFYQIDAAKACGADFIEIHTGTYCEATGSDAQQELIRISKAAQYADELGLVVNAGHGLHYHNVQAIAEIPQIHELNIGHSIVSRALMTGFQEAVATMNSIMQEARRAN